MAFEILLERLVHNGPLRGAIDALLVRKRASAEIEEGPRIPEISTYLETTLARMESATPRLGDAVVDHEWLDGVFRSLLSAG